MVAVGFLFLLSLLALAEAEAAALLWVARRLRRRHEGAAAAAAQPGDQELPGVVPSTEGCFLRPLLKPCTSSPPYAPTRLGRSSSVSTTRCAGRKGPLDCTGRMGCRPLLLDLALLLDHVAPGFLILVKPFSGSEGSDGMDECSFIHGASADHSFFERGIWASILGLAPDYVLEGGVLICFVGHSASVNKAGETLGSTDEKDGLALTDATTNAKRFEPSVPTVSPTTVGKKGRRK